MAAQGKVLYNYNGEYKKGLIGKKKVSATLYEDYIEGTGAKYYVGELKEVPFKVNISDIKKVEIKEINDNKCIQIEYVSEEPDDKDKGTSKLLLPNVAKIDEAKKVLYDLVDKLFQEATQKAIMERVKREKTKKFYNEKKESYGLNEDNTYYALKDRDMQYVGFSVEKSSVAVIAIDSENLQDGKFYIAYDKVRYFGKLEKIQDKVEYISQLEFDGVSIDISDMGTVVLTYKNVNGKYVALRLPGDIYDELEKAIPDKEYSLVIAAEKAEEERLEAERLAKQKEEEERIAKEKAEAERIAKEKAEAERLEAERIAKEKAEAERLEAERIAKEKAEAERIAKEKAEAERIAKEKAEAERLEAERIAKEKAEAERLEAERIAKEKAEAEKAEAERIAKEKAEAEKAEAERIAKEKAEAEKAEAERIAKEKAEAEKMEAELMAKKKEADERKAREAEELERLEAARVAAEKAEKERLEAEQLAQIREAEREEAERKAKEKAEEERKAKEKAEAEKAEAERKAKEKAEAEKKAETKSEPVDDMVAFEKRIKKLMIMKNTGILTEEEFEAEKKKLFDLL